MQKTKTLVFFLILLILIPSLMFPQSNSQEEQQKQVVNAVWADEPITIDGLLKEKVWQGEGYSSFTQSDPLDGAPPTEKTVVWIACDRKAVYIGARLYDSEPGKIISLLGRRDQYVNSDWFFFAVDPYYDRRSGYEFGINPASSIVDYTIYNDEQIDATWDGVWESKARIDEQGWSLEMKIPFDQLRFKRKKKNVWGVNFSRTIKRKNEVVHFVWIPKEDSGYVSHFARLEGLASVKPGRFIEFLPFTVGKAALNPEEVTPFEKREEFTTNAGLDVKVGLKPNLTLDLSINPDFGQVEVDPAIINLTAVESYYYEKRPFFIEGNNIFRFGKGGANFFWESWWDDPNFFYSRRIGRPPQGYVTSPGYARYPDWATILAAGKLTGQIGSGWNIGFLSALSQREYAEIDWEGNTTTEEVEPFTYYGVFRLQKEFEQGRHGLGFISTAVLRDLRTDTLEDFLAQKAFSFALDGWASLDKKNTWVVTGWFGTTRVSGNQTALYQIQQSYPHYFQRPDVTHVELDENATSMAGWAGRFTLNKQKGHFIFNAAVGAIEPGFNSTDMGFQWSSDRINYHALIGYQWWKPGKIFRYWATRLFTAQTYDFGGNKIADQRLVFWGEAQFLNYWYLRTMAAYGPGRWSQDLTRGGPLVRMPVSTWYDFTLSTDNRKLVVVSLHSYLTSEKSGSNISQFDIGLYWKPRKNLTLAIEPQYIFNNDVVQWVYNLDDPLMTDTYGKRHLFAEIVQKTLACSIRLDWSFNPKLSLQAYIQPFISVGAYNGFKELARSRSFDFNLYGEGDSTISYKDRIYIVDPDGPGPASPFGFYSPNFNYKSLRGTVVFRWEYRPGSALYLVWTQNREDFSYPGDFDFGRSLRTLFDAPAYNILMLKFTYQFKL